MRITIVDSPMALYEPLNLQHGRAPRRALGALAKSGGCCGTGFGTTQRACLAPRASRHEAPARTK